MNVPNLEEFYTQINNRCIAYFESKQEKTVIELAEDCMDLPGLPIHCPPHHFLVPAVLLTVCRKKGGDSLSYLQEDLQEANVRAHNILGGFCGLYGDCGAAVGTGIFLSIYTQTGPCSEGSWAWTNRITARSLMSIAEIDGPRCCKRNTYFALISARETIKEYLGIILEIPEKISCKYSTQNEECKELVCPFFKGR